MKHGFNCEEALQIIQDFLTTYISNAQAKKVIIGLSGGIDSAVVAILCQKTFGSNKIQCYFLPETVTPKEDVDHMHLLVDTFSLPCKEIDITSLVQQFRTIVPDSDNKFILANIKARIRMVLLYQQANKVHGLVCGTSNKSEILIGYCTKYGDSGVDIQPLGDVYKTQVYELAKYLGIPHEIIKKPPTAGLWKGQTDEKQLGMSYETIDAILQGLEKKQEFPTIAQQYKISLRDIERINNMVIISEHKRRAPLIPKIGIRTPGFDWRIPIQEG